MKKLVLSCLGLPCVESRVRKFEDRLRIETLLSYKLVNRFLESRFEVRAIEPKRLLECQGETFWNYLARCWTPKWHPLL